MLEAIELDPGIHLRELGRRLGCAMGTLLYHLYALTAAGLITSLQLGNRRHLYHQGFPKDPQLRRITALLRHPKKREIIRALHGRMTLHQAELATLLGMDRRLISYYVKGLIREGILQRTTGFNRSHPLTLSTEAQRALHQLKLGEERS